MIITIEFIVDIQGKPAKISITNLTGELTFTVNGQVLGALSITGRSWHTNTPFLQPAMLEISTRYYDIVKRYKWNLPAAIRSHFTQAKITDLEGIYLTVRRGLDYRVVGKELLQYFSSQDINPDIPVRLKSFDGFDTYNLADIV